MAPEVITGSAKERAITLIQDGGGGWSELRGGERQEHLCPPPRWRSSWALSLAPPRGHGPAFPSPLPPPTRSAHSWRWCSREESRLSALDMAAAAVTAATKGNGAGGGRAGAGEASGSRKKKGPGPLATAYLVIYNVVMTAGWGWGSGRRERAWLGRGLCGRQAERRGSVRSAPGVSGSGCPSTDTWALRAAEAEPARVPAPDSCLGQGPSKFPATGRALSWSSGASWGIERFPRRWSVGPWEDGWAGHTARFGGLCAELSCSAESPGGNSRMSSVPPKVGGGSSGCRVTIYWGGCFQNPGWALMWKKGGGKAFKVFAQWLEQTCFRGV